VVQAKGKGKGKAKAAAPKPKKAKKSFPYVEIPSRKKGKSKTPASNAAGPSRRDASSDIEAAEDSSAMPADQEVADGSPAPQVRQIIPGTTEAMTQGIVRAFIGTGPDVSETLECWRSQSAAATAGLPATVPVSTSQQTRTTSTSLPSTWARILRRLLLPPPPCRLAKLSSQTCPRLRLLLRN
jgi:hypothetical protein